MFLYPDKHLHGFIGCSILFWMIFSWIGCSIGSVLKKYQPLLSKSISAYKFSQKSQSETSIFSYNKHININLMYFMFNVWKYIFSGFILNVLTKHTKLDILEFDKSWTRTFFWKWQVENDVV